MTTEATTPTGGGGTMVLLVATATTLAATALASGLGALVQGRTAALGALVGGLVAVGVLCLGTWSMHLVAGVLPGASLALALLTYGLQVVLTLALLVGLDGSGLVGPTLDRQWLAGTLVVVVLGWLVGHVVGAVRVRIPIYDLPVAGPAHGREAGAR